MPKKQHQIQLFEFQYQSSNKSVSITIGEDGDVHIADILEAVRDILVAGGFNYVDEIRAVSFGDRENKVFSSNREDEEWEEPIDFPPPLENLEKMMAEETIREAGYDAVSALNTKSGLTENEVKYADGESF